MPWKETRVMDEKIKMIGNWLSGEYSITELSRIHEVSRKTLYKWIERYKAEQAAGLEDRSRKPVEMPRATSAELVGDILAAKIRHEHWGSRKLLAWLAQCQPEKRWPAASTTSEILKRHGMVHTRRKRHHAPPYSQPFFKSNQPNEVWCADYKGQFRLGEGKLCYPLTLSDSHSRFLLGCWGYTIRHIYRPGIVLSELFTNLVYPVLSARITVYLLFLLVLAGFRIWRCGLSNWGYARNALRKATRSKTGGMKGCTEHSRLRPSARRVRT